MGAARWVMSWLMHYGSELSQCCMVHVARILFLKIIAF